MNDLLTLTTVCKKLETAINDILYNKDKDTHQNGKNTVLYILPAYKLVLFECFPIKMNEKTNSYLNVTYISTNDLKAEYTQSIRNKYSGFIKNLHLCNYLISKWFLNYLLNNKEYFTNYILSNQHTEARDIFKDLIINSIIKLDHIIPMHDIIIKFIDMLLNYIKTDTIIEENWFRFEQFWQILEYIIVSMDIYNNNSKYKEYFVKKQEFISILGIFMYQSESPYNMNDENLNLLTPNKVYFEMGSKLFKPHFDSIYHILSVLISFCNHKFSENDCKLLYFKKFYQDMVYQSQYLNNNNTVLIYFCQILNDICFENLEISKDVIKTILFYMHKDVYHRYRSTLTGFSWCHTWKELDALWTISKHLISTNDSKKEERMKSMFFKDNWSPFNISQMIMSFIDDIDNQAQQSQYCIKLGILQFIQFASLQLEKDMEYCQHSKEKMNQIINIDQEFDSFLKSIQFSLTTSINNIEYNHGTGGDQFKLMSQLSMNFVN